ncbi:unnamed protein product [Soboliphyme baturini]|uniref:Secreted protein n=1 Tax=Soboliphyme baturini TaxID=241478 RepID=A0A183IJV0_9BILA|nr:unnamed protein product [Soboliphyme baturini]
MNVTKCLVIYSAIGVLMTNLINGFKCPDEDVLVDVSKRKKDVVTNIDALTALSNPRYSPSGYSSQSLYSRCRYPTYVAFLPPVKYVFLIKNKF